jgi:ribonuclease-3
MYQDEQLTLTEIKNKILNEKNIPITTQFINSIFKRFNFKHKVKNLENYQIAMTHSSYLVENLTNVKTIKLLKEVSSIEPQYIDSCMPLATKSYERLEFLGDSIIRHAIGKYLFLRYTNEDEGFLTTNRSKMENKNALANLSRNIGIHKYAVISRYIETANGRTTYISLLEDIFEAFIGAVLLELGDAKTIDFIWIIIENIGDVAETIRTQNNYKDQLMQIYHKKFNVKHDLQYNDDEYESDNKKYFKTIVIDKTTNEKLGIGTGKSKKSSQQRAAKDALIKIGSIGNDEVSDEYYDIRNINIDEELKKVKLLT